MASPLVSIVMPTFNGARHLRTAIESIFAQSLRDWELIVVDDGSGDDTTEIASAFADPRIRVIERHANGGPAVARNEGFAAATGRYVAALDQDDICRPGRLRRQVAFLDRRRDFVLVATSHSTLADGRCRYRPHLRRSSPAALDWLMMVRNPLTWSTVMIRAEALRRLDVPMRPELTYAEDFDLYHRLRRFGRIGRIDRDLLIYRDHPAGISKRHRDRAETAATAVLTERYLPLFGHEAAGRARQAIRHLGLCEPVADPATLVELRETLRVLRDDMVGRSGREDAGPIGRAARRSWRSLLARSPIATSRPFARF